MDAKWRNSIGTGDVVGQTCAPARAMGRLAKVFVLLVSLIWLGMWSGSASAVTYISIATGNWATATTWATQRAGTITTVTTGKLANRNIVTGTGTTFTALAAGQTIYTAAGVVIGTISAITSDTSLLLVANAASANAGIPLYVDSAGTAPMAADTVTVNTGHTVTIAGIAGGAATSLTINGTATNSAILTVATTLAGTGGLTNGATGTLEIGGTSAINTLAATAVGNTVNYTGAVQTVKATTYSNLTLSGSGAKTTTGVAVNDILSMEGATTASVAPTYGANATLRYNTATARTAGVEWATPFAATGGVIIANSGVITMGAAKVLNASVPLTINSGATLDTGAFQITVGGNVSNTGTHTATTTGSITLSGGAVAHTLSGNGTYANLILNDTLGAILSGSPTVSGTLTLTSGTITTGANTLITSANCPGSVSRTTGYVIGNLQLAFPAGTTGCIFDVGDSIGYAPVTVALTGATAGTLSGRVDSGDHPDTLANLSGIDQTRSANHYWTLTPGTLAAYTNYAATFQFCAAACTNAERDATATVGNFIVAKKNAGAWIRPTVTGTPITTIQATGITLAQGFGEFAVGEPLVTFYRGVRQLIDLREVY